MACDIDPEAAGAAPVPFFVGSADAVRTGAFDVLVANISEDVVGVLQPELERVASIRILSGFKNDRGEWACVVTKKTKGAGHGCQLP